jgi:hypothetical protein
VIARDGWRCVRCLSTSWVPYLPPGTSTRIRECGECAYIDRLAQMESNSTQLLRKEAGP